MLAAETMASQQVLTKMMHLAMKMALSTAVRLEATAAVMLVQNIQC